MFYSKRSRYKGKHQRCEENKLQVYQETVGKPAFQRGEVFSHCFQTQIHAALLSRRSRSPAGGACPKRAPASFPQRAGAPFQSTLVSARRGTGSPGTEQTTGKIAGEGNSSAAFFWSAKYAHGSISGRAASPPNRAFLSNGVEYFNLIQGFIDVSA